MSAVPLDLAEHPAVTRQRLQRRLSTLIERLIVMLDDLDGDADFEPDGDDEPSLGFQEVRAFDSQDVVIRLSPIGPVAALDLEIACEDEGAEHDGREPETDG